MEKVKRGYYCLVLTAVSFVLSSVLVVRNAQSTPSTTFWAPSTPYLQPFGVLHITYDTYFNHKTAYPIITGLTIGLLPLKELNWEFGFDLFLPSPFKDQQGKEVFPLLLNTKIGTPEDTFFKGQPGWSFGIFNLGFEKGVNNYNILYFMLGKTMLEDWGALKYLGTIQVGAFYGLEKTLFKSSDGKENNLGLLAGWFSYPIDVPIIEKIVLTADIMTGKHSLGAWGGGIYFFITPTIDLLTGPVFFFDKTAAGVPEGWIWTLQLDVDIDLKGGK